MKLLSRVKVAAVGIAVGILGLGVGQSHAVSLQDLFDGESITIGNTIFDDWDLFALNFTTPERPDLSEIKVLPLDDQPNNPGLKYDADGELKAKDGERISLEFGFRVATLDGVRRINDSSLELVDFGLKDGRISITQIIDDDDPSFATEFSVEAPQLLFASAVFEPQPFIFVGTDIEVFGADEAELEIFEQRFSQVAAEPIPEPGTLLLLGLGVAGLGVGACRRNRKNR